MNFPRKKLEAFTEETSGLFSYTVVRDLAFALLDEIDKPKAWDGAPDWATYATITWSDGKTNGKQIQRLPAYRRELPKSIERTISESYSHRYFQSGGMMPITEDEIACLIEDAINEFKRQSK